MKTSNKLLLGAYGLIILALSVAVFSTKNLVERAMIRETSYYSYQNSGEDEIS